MLQWKIFMVMALIGHILCGILDCFLTYAPNGKVDLTNFKLYEKSKESFRGMPLKNLSIAMILGVAAMTLEIFGYLAIVIMPTKLPAKANVIGAIMFAGLIFLI